jgi:hypothetical protein
MVPSVQQTHPSLASLRPCELRPDLHPTRTSVISPSVSRHKRGDLLTPPKSWLGCITVLWYRYCLQTNTISSVRSKTARDGGHFHSSRCHRLPGECWATVRHHEGSAIHAPLRASALASHCGLYPRHAFSLWPNRIFWTCSRFQSREWAVQVFASCPVSHVERRYQPFPEPIVPCIGKSKCRTPRGRSPRPCSPNLVAAGAQDASSVDPVSEILLLKEQGPGVFAG